MKVDKRLRVVTPGIDDLGTTDSAVAAEWDYCKNGTLLPSQIARSFAHKVWWRCSKGHSYDAPPARRTSQGSGCPFCAMKKLLTGFNDLLTMAPKLAAEWDVKENGGVLPSQALAGGHTKRWWRCPVGHSYDARIKSRMDGRGCPYCSGRRVLEGFNDFGTAHPSLAKAWDSQRNDLAPTEVTNGSNRQFWWRCEVGHGYRTTVPHRIRGHGCPYCSGRRVLEGFNDLLSQVPEIAEEWNVGKNKLGPHEVTRASGERVWWRCVDGHSYATSVANRVTKGSECSRCIAGNKVSKIGLRFVSALADHFSDITPEVDFPVPWVPSRPGQPLRVDGYGTFMGLRVAFEFDGPWHVGRGAVDARKVDRLLSTDLVDAVVRVRYDYLPLLADTDPRHFQFHYKPRSDIEPVVSLVVEALKGLRKAGLAA